MEGKVLRVAGGKPGSKLNILIILSIFTYPMTFGLLSPFLGVISQAFSLNYRQAGLIYTLFSTGYLVSALFIGTIADKHGIRVIIWGLLINAAASVLIFAVRSFALFLAAIVILGISLGIEDIMSATSLTRLNPERKGFYLNIMQFTGSMAGILLSIMAGLLVQNGISWRYAYVLAFTFAIVLFAFLRREPFPMNAPSSDLHPKAVAPLVPDMRLILLSLLFFCIFAIESGIFGWLGLYMTGRFHVSGFLSGFSISLLYLAMGFGRLLVAFISDRVRHTRLILCSSAVSAIFIVFALAAGNAVISLSLFVLTMFASASLFTTAISFAGSLFPERTGTVLSVLFSSGTIGSILVPGLIGSIAQAASLKTGLSVLVYLCVAVFIATALLARILMRHSRPVDGSRL
jgi:MFS transporter, FHS family, glucose/mannose:H+ symporter